MRPSSLSGGSCAIFRRAFTCSIPVLLGYLAIGVAFGLMLTQAGYPWPLSLLMSVVIYAGAGQYLAVGLFAAGVPLVQAVLLEFVVNARHIAYGITLLSRFRTAGKYRPYLIFALTDETFALLSSADFKGTETEEARFMFYVSLLNHVYWTAGSLAGAIAGSLLPFSLDGVSFALTSLFVVLMIEQSRRVKNPLVIALPALIAVLGSVFLPEKASLLGSLGLSLALVSLFDNRKTGEKAGREC